ncbi:hypothetical protein MOO44_00615 (plasmid) [Nicoliella spurrieriana]|uniref:Uncharacterized protein n=1 Tax=Nicoliella spurrieriana TaxID=2925830 RepID=A0A976X525_9LACO|nr:hypothetical protein [Nicoliella spurrieriana]UQS86176.1 hypothetical protein MOO44_00615 [Nicoliella spurrieriana]
MEYKSILENEIKKLRRESIAYDADKEAERSLAILEIVKYLDKKALTKTSLGLSMKVQIKLLKVHLTI